MRWAYAWKSPPNAQVRLVEARWVGPAEAGDKAYMYVRVQDEQGKPLPGRSFGLNSKPTRSNSRVERTKGPGLDDFYGNFPMYPGVVHTVDIPGGTSDRVIGVKRGAPDNPGANTCIYLVFQHGAIIVSPPPPPPGQPSTIDEPLVRGCWPYWTKHKSRSTPPACCWRTGNDPQTASRRLPLALDFST